MAEVMRLELLGEKTLHQMVNPELLAYCPSMDLIALGSTDQQVLIYRLNGQRVYGAAQKFNTLRVEKISWKPNGQLLAIAWSDGSVRLVGAESTKVVHHFSATSDDQDFSGITCMSWSSNTIGRKVANKTSKLVPNTLKNIFANDSELSTGKGALDLPRDLALLDIEPSLPKLSVLPTGGTSDEVFSSRSSLDALFRPFNPEDNEMADVMVVGTKEGNIHLSIYDSFVVGSFKAPVVVHRRPAYLVSHASHKLYSTHALLMKTTESEERIYFVPMDLRFLSASSEYLSILASRSTALENLLRYINQIRSLMLAEWKSAQELPSRFLHNVNETLATQDNRDIVQALYHSVATGHTFPVVREWLVDELTERGHKRWDKAVVSGLENLRRLVHENMLPALDRCSVILSRLNGIAKFQGPDSSLGFTSAQITSIMDTVASLHLVSAKILLQVVDELELFTSFSAWLRHEIDRLASDGSSSQNDDNGDKEASIDHVKVLLYIQTVMINSPLAAFIGEVTPEDYQNESAHIGKGIQVFDLLTRQLEKQEQGSKYRKTLPQVEFLYKYLRNQAAAIFTQIANAEKSNVHFGRASELGMAHKDVPVEMKMNMIDRNVCHNYIAFVPKDSLNQVQVVQIELFVENGISTVRSTNSSVLQLGDGQIMDFKFMDDSTILVLWEANGKCNLLGIPYNNGSGSHIKYQPHRISASRSKAIILSNEEVINKFLQTEFPGDGSIIPEIMMIRSQIGSKNDDQMKRLVVLAKDRLRYKVFKLAGESSNRNISEDIPMS
ncbi:c06f7089-702f-465a-9a30-5ce32c70bb1d [Sclerotinia trifoliorum]|uniref:Anaphase-promoting complex subunit 4 n=1 Tax=Sclerotinia trifoliorum TaxID=28548 RepID=A0A8H2ZQE8_9HELO|nr:c06f7089-702f-465a-9a30-5ce32c70bb1d [Sclerotinia trifoliorum]